MVLVDTSIWIEVFRKSARFRLETSVEIDEVVTCPPIVQEVLQGFRDEAAYRLARDSMLSLPIVESPLTLDRFEDAVRLYRLARKSGLTIRSGVDCLTAACAIRNGLPVLHKDRDFDVIARISTLQVRSLRP